MNENQRPVLINDPDMTLASPRFDAEATVTAQPVVPIVRRAADHANAAVGRVVSLSNRRRSLLLGMFVVSALFVGVAGGFGLALYRDRQTADAAVNLPAPPETTSSQPNVKDTPAAITQTTGARKDETRSQRTTTDAPIVSTRSRDSRSEANATVKETSRDSSAATTRRKKTDNADDRTASVKDRNSRTAKTSADEERSRVRDERERRRGERREEKRSRQDERASRREVRAIDRVGDVLSNRPRRATQRNAPETRRVDRIRDIFEGRQP